MRRRVKIAVAAVVLLAVVALFALPVRTLLAQRQSLAVSHHRMQVLTHENGQLRRQAADLQNTAKIEQIARQQYGLTRPGTEAYAILPPAAPPTTTTVPNARP
ncbi:MAG: FtsB family cell division protein [Acidimicrobiales bacterium]